VSQPIGSLCVVLHAHLPFVRHPEYDVFLEEDWLFEAVCETYIPLLNMMEGLTRDGVDFRLTMSLTPTLLSMFGDELLQQRTRRHVEQLIELSDREVARTKDQAAFAPLAVMYRDHFHGCLAVLDRCGGDLSREFRRYQDQGNLEIITCGATHGFLPLMAHQPEAVRAQIQVAVNHYQRVLGRAPRGIWLPECGYYPGHEHFLAEAGLRFCFTEAHGVLFGSPRPRYGTFAPVLCPNAPVAVFGRDLESSKQVWSAIEGYPGDAAYREFYRDVGYDLDYGYVRPYLGPLGERKNLGIKYHRITGPSDSTPLGKKQPYDPALARERAAEHAGNFLFNRFHQMKHAGETLGRLPLVVAPYDAELFGHWWWEGPQFLDFLFRKAHFDQDAVRVVTPSEYLEQNPVLQCVQPELSSWGYRGYAEFWLNETNDWVYRHLHQAAERMVWLARSHPAPSDQQRRALDQCARELLLAQASDWAFIMKTGTMVEYARKRTGDHLLRFERLFAGLRQGEVDEAFLVECERRDCIFPDLDYRVYA
jgi:1,4-alpha-glucan branching enzyme